MTMEYLKQNLILFKSIDATAATQVRTAKSGSYTVEESKNPAEYTLKINGKYLYSKYKPSHSAARGLPDLEPQTKTVLVIGIGLGYHIELLAEQRPDVFIIVIEPDPALFKLFLSTRDRGELLENPAILWLVNQTGTVLENRLQARLSYTDLPGFKIIDTYQPVDFATGKRLQIKKTVSMLISEITKNFWTKYFMEETWSRNLVANFPHLLKSTPVKHFFNRFKQVPAVIVCAGPSLDKNIHLLKKIDNNAVIIAVDTALRSVLHAGVTPHLVISLDAQKENFKDFLHINTAPLCLLYDLITYPQIVNDFKGSKIASITGHHIFTTEKGATVEFTPFWETIRHSVEDIGYLQTGGSVSLSAFDAARLFGCNPIIFIGQDLAFSEQKTHAADAYDRQQDTDSLTKFKTNETANFLRIAPTQVQNGIQVKAINGGLVQTNLVMQHYLNWLGEACARVPVDCIDATEGGALIPGTTVMPFAEVITSYITGTNRVSALFAAGLQKKADVNLDNLRSTVDDILSLMIELKSSAARILAPVDINTQHYIEDPRAETFRKKIEHNRIPLLHIYEREFQMRCMGTEKLYPDRAQRKKIELIIWYEVMLQAADRITGLLNDFAETLPKQ